MSHLPQPYLGGHLVVVIDCGDLDRSAQFWSSVLGYVRDGPASGRYQSLVPASGPGIEILLQRVPEAKSGGKNRLHLDLRTAGLDAEVGRVVRLGARRLTSTPVIEAGWCWHILADPDGNEFCILQPPVTYWEGEAIATSTRSGDLPGAEFADANLRGARFRRADLSGVVMRAVDVRGADIDAPWLFNGESFLRVNGVDVVPLVEAELNRRFPGRAGRRATDPDGLRVAWAALERTWAGTLERAAAMPAGTVEVSVDGEWSFAQTLRHLVMATDTWLGRAILGIEQPFHRIGQPNAEYETDGNDMSVFATVTPPYTDVLEARAGRVAMVRDFLTTVTSDDLTAARKNPWAPEYPETILSCLHVILREEWEHHRYAVRDLDTIDAASGA